MTIIGFCRCGEAKEDPPSKGETVLFRTSDDNLIFSLKIDNDFTYYDSLLSKDIPMGFPIGRYKKKKESSVIHLRINGKDTTFKFPLFKVDSILFGLRPNGKFYIATNYDRFAWMME